MKIALKLLGGFCLLLILVIAGVWFYMDVIIKSAVERVGPEVTGTEVRLDSARLSPLSGSGSLNGFAVGNPEGFEYPNAFTLGAIDLEIDPSTLGSDVILIKNINIVSPKIFYENNANGDNLQTLMDNIEKNTGGGSSDQTEEAAGEEKKIIIERFSLSDGDITVSHSRLNDVIEVPMPDLVLTDIGRNSNGATISQASAQIFEQITVAATKAVVESALVSEIRNQVEGLLEDQLDGSEQLEEAKEQVEGLLEGFGF